MGPVSLLVEHEVGCCMSLRTDGTSTVLIAPSIARPKLQSFLLATILFGASAVSLLILKFAPAPFFWFWLTWTAALWTTIPAVRRSWPRAILFSLGIVTCQLAIAEAYLITHEYTTTVFSDGFVVPDQVLGFAPTKGIQAHAFKHRTVGLFHAPSGTLFDVIYTIDSNGLRVAPPYNKSDLAGTAVFFGCSFAFGEGLQDNQTLPYQVGSRSGGRYRTINFAFEGYSPAQMLAELEHGIVQGVVDTQPKYAFYVAIPNHVWRVAGRVAWAAHAPRYVLNADGTLREEGNFENREPLALRLGLGNRIDKQLRKSAIWRAFSMRDYRVNDDDLRLYFAMVRRSQELITAQYPGIRFRVILWPNQEVPQERETYEKLQEGFSRMAVPFDLVEDILPGYKTDRSPYILGSTDHHPNALANRLLAEHLLREMGSNVIE